MIVDEVKTYYIFIIYLIVLLYVNIIALFDTFNISMEKLRTLNNTFVPFLTLYMVLNLKLTKIMKIIIFLWFLGILRFWLFNKEYIFYFIQKTPQSIKFVNEQMKYNLGIVDNVFMICIELYCLYFIFSS
jgi:hypothetical protein